MNLISADWEEQRSDEKPKPDGPRYAGPRMGVSWKIRKEQEQFGLMRLGKEQPETTDSFRRPAR